MIYGISVNMALMPFIAHNAPAQDIRSCKQQEHL